MTIASRKFIYWLLPLALAAIAGLWLAHDGRHHWDEPSYLYAGLYQTPEQIIEGRIQPSGIPNFTQGRILHALFVKGVMTAAGDGPSGFHALVAINFLLIVASFVLMFHILRDCCRTFLSGARLPSCSRCRPSSSISFSSARGQ